MQCMSEIGENIDAKTLKAHAIRYAKIRNVEPRSAFAALDDWRYVTLGKVAYLIAHGFPVTDQTTQWIDTKIAEIVRDGIVVLSETGEQPEIVSVRQVRVPKTTDELVEALVLLIDGDKLAKDRDAPNKLMRIENPSKSDAEAIRAKISNRYNQYLDALKDQESDLYKQLKSTMTHSTIVRRRSEYAKLVQSITDYITSKG